MTKKRVSIKTRLYVFILCIILLITIITSIITYITLSNSLDNIYKNATIDNARNFATYVDGDFIAEFKEIIKSEEYQELRQKAEETENEQLIEDYLREKDVWAKFADTRNKIDDYLDNIKGVRYIYLVDYNNTINAEKDMYIIDDSNSELYIIGYYEYREKEFKDKDITNLDEPVISHGDWGWLCSNYAPVYDSNGNPVCIVGCDVDMNKTMHDRHMFILFFIGLIISISIFIYIGAIYLVNKLIIKPLSLICKETQAFNPNEADNKIIDLNLPNNEIGDIYQSIRTMQLHIIEYINNINQKDDALKSKDTQILSLKNQTFKDILTNVGNARAYNQKSKEISGIYAIVMADINNLKQINDKYGHKIGDEYIKGCCNIICEAFKHSPVFRIGGDEFVIILQGADYENRNYIVDNLVKKFDDIYNRQDISPEKRYSMSLGMADRDIGDTIEDVYRKADNRMYANKTLFKEIYGSYR